MGSRTVEEVFPNFAAELEALTAKSDRPDLVQQIRTLPVLGRCKCGQRNCALFYTGPKPSVSYGAGLTNVVLPSKRGLIVYDVVDGRIAAIEVLDRPDVKAALDEYLAAAAPVRG